MGVTDSPVQARGGGRLQKPGRDRRC